jgi:hypothetical protein
MPSTVGDESRLVLRVLKQLSDGVDCETVIEYISCVHPQYVRWLLHEVRESTFRLLIQARKAERWSNDREYISSVTPSR